MDRMVAKQEKATGLNSCIYNATKVNGAMARKAGTGLRQSTDGTWEAGGAAVSIEALA